MAQHRRRKHRLDLWGRRRSRVLELAQREQDAEHQAALRRILEDATRTLPTVRCAPLLTPGQEYRADGRRP